MALFPLALLLAVSATPSPPPPEGTRAPEPPDENLWLEEVTGEKALAWARERNAESAKALEPEGVAKLEARLLSILDSDARIPLVDRQGRWLYNFWKDARNPHGLWRRTTLAEYRKASPAWETVLDLDALGAAEHESWVWEGAECLRPAYRRCLLSLSRGGADASVVREFDLSKKAFVPGGFTLPEAKSRVAWLDANTLYVGTDFGPGSMTSSGYPRVVKVWKRGTPLAAARTVYQGQPDDVSVTAFRDLTRGFQRDLVERRITFFSSELFLRKGDTLVRIDKPDSARATVWRELLLVSLRDDWTVGGRTYPAGALLAASLDAFLAGERSLDLLFEPTERRSLAAFVVTRHHVILNELDNVRNRLFRLRRDHGAWTREPLPGLPDLASIDVSAVDEEASDALWISVTDFLTPTSLSLASPGQERPELLKQLPTFFDAAGLVTQQHEAVSQDGTRVPYFEVAREGITLDGQNPTLLYGYGGFEIPELPLYRGTNGAAWLERGGVYVVANIRGGGEFGPRWHKAALKAARPRAYEDFIAVAEDLVRRKVTSPAHLGILGGSNGGLLVGNALTMRPDLFGAVVCMVPLLDMRRYHRLLAGASWMGEYGNPDLPEEWAFIQAFSPYHNLREGVRYPPTLFMTSTRDDRVHPGHARKMAARMLAAKQDVLYHENIEGGHGGAATNAQAAHMYGLAYAFLWSKLR
jgi:prolyl oligopeptidase